MASLSAKKTRRPNPRPASIASFPLVEDWAEIFTGRSADSLHEVFPKWLASRRWFRSKMRRITSVSIQEKIPVPMPRQKAFLALLQVNYAEGKPELYVMPLTCAFGKKAAAIAREWPQLVLANVSLKHPRQTGILYDAIVSKDFCRALLTLTAQGHTTSGHNGSLTAEPTRVLRRMRREHALNIEPSVGKAEQSNSSIIYKGRLILKFFRRLDQGINPELEIERFLSAHNFSHSPTLAGALEYHHQGGKSSTMAVITSFVPGCHDAWEDTLAALSEFYQRVKKLPGKLKSTPPKSGTWGLVAGKSSLPRTPADLVGSYLEDAVTIGRRTASLHLTLASDSTDPAFKPERWTRTAQKTLATSLIDLTRHNFELLRERLSSLPADVQLLAEKVLAQESLVLQRFQRLNQQSAPAMRIRNHGDYHLGQVLHHEKDFLIIDFEGEPAITLEERRAKQSALRDVAGMIYSFFYAANASLRQLPNRRASRAQDELGAAWARYWSVWVGTTFLRAYLETARSAVFIPADENSLRIMLDVELLRKAIYELGYELNNRPDWLNISLQVLLDLLNPDNPI